MPEPPADRSAFLERLGICPRDPARYELALTHRSWAFEAGGRPHNERLEFLGDAVLGLVIADLLYARLPDAPEGRLATLRAAAVNSASLADVARDLDLGAHVRLGKGEEASGGRDKDSILADTLEALIGAIHLDAGLDAATAWVTAVFSPLLAALVERGGALDAKTALQELTAAERSALPVYQVRDEGPDHRKHFTAAVAVDGEVLGVGVGGSKKRAEQAAAREALAVLARRTGRVSSASTAPGVAVGAADSVPSADRAGGDPREDVE